METTEAKVKREAAEGRVIKTRSSRACLSCRSRKRKCDGNHPCANCGDIAECVYAPPKKRGRKSKSGFDERINITFFETKSNKKRKKEEKIETDLALVQPLRRPFVVSPVIGVDHLPYVLLFESYLPPNWVWLFNCKDNAMGYDVFNVVKCHQKPKFKNWKHAVDFLQFLLIFSYAKFRRNEDPRDFDERIVELVMFLVGLNIPQVKPKLLTILAFIDLYKERNFNIDGLTLQKAIKDALANEEYMDAANIFGSHTNALCTRHEETRYHLAAFEEMEKNGDVPIIHVLPCKILVLEFWTLMLVNFTDSFLEDIGLNFQYYWNFLVTCEKMLNENASIFSHNWAEKLHSIICAKYAMAYCYRGEQVLSISYINEFISIVNTHLLADPCDNVIAQIPLLCEICVSFKKYPLMSKLKELSEHFGVMKKHWCHDLVENIKAKRRALVEKSASLSGIAERIHSPNHPSRHFEYVGGAEQTNGVHNGAQNGKCVVRRPIPLRTPWVAPSASMPLRKAQLTLPSISTFTDQFQPKQHNTDNKISLILNDEMAAPADFNFETPEPISLRNTTRPTSSARGSFCITEIVHSPGSPSAFGAIKEERAPFQTAEELAKLSIEPQQPKRSRTPDSITQSAYRSPNTQSTPSPPHQPIVLPTIRSLLSFSPNDTDFFAPEAT